MLNNLKNISIILASKSPRRKQLLEDMGIQFKLANSNFDESSIIGNNPTETAELLAKGKAQSIQSSQKNNELIISADTIVVLDNEVMGKPINKIDAFNMLSKLSGKTHDVITAVCILTSNQLKTFSEITKVHFRVLTAEEINYYIDNYEPFDKAGSYGIQEWLGIIAVEKIEGSYHNVMGLPTQKLYEYLISIN